MEAKGMAIERKKPPLLMGVRFLRGLSVAKLNFSTDRYIHQIWIPNKLFKLNLNNLGDFTFE